MQLEQDSMVVDDDAGGNGGKKQRYKMSRKYSVLLNQNIPRHQMKHIFG